MQKPQLLIINYLKTDILEIWRPIANSHSVNKDIRNSGLLSINYFNVKLLDSKQLPHHRSAVTNTTT